MSYIRVKKIKKKSGNEYEYAYLVENKWKKRLKGGKKGARQKVKAFLGRNYKRSIVNDIDFFEYSKIDDVSQYVNSNSLKQIVKDLVKWEFYRHDIKDVIVDWNNNSIRNYKNKVVLQMNEGFLCNDTLRKLIRFRFKSEEEHAGIALAKVFVDSGLQIPQEVFVKLFEKIS